MEQAELEVGRRLLPGALRAPGWRRVTCRPLQMEKGGAIGAWNSDRRAHLLKPHVHPDKDRAGQRYLGPSSSLSIKNQFLALPGCSPPKESGTTAF